MKKYYPLIMIACAMMLASCSMKVFPTSELMFNYNMSMKTADELDAKSRVKIFLKETDIKGDYQVVSVVKYTPFTFPIFVSYESAIRKNVLKKAVLEAYEDGGNAILIDTPECFRILNLSDWDAETASSSSFVNAIFDMSLCEKFKGGVVSQGKKAQIKRDEREFTGQIRNDLKYAFTLEETDAILEKINVLDQYNQSLPKPKPAIEKDLKKLRSEYKQVVRKINNRLKSEARKAAKGGARKK